MRRNRRNTRRAQTTDVPRVCPCGAFVEGRGAYCRKCRGRLRWLQRMSGRRRDHGRQNSQDTNHYFRKAVSFS